MTPAPEGRVEEAGPGPEEDGARATVRIGLLGCGVVGSATARILVEHASELGLRAGASLELVAVAVRDVSKSRPIDLSPQFLTEDAWSVVRNPDIDVVVEVMGGVSPARELVIEALRTGKHVVSANKELLSSAGQEVMEAAERTQADLLFEASVAGGIPIIRSMKESLAGDRVRRVIGIVNGTTNYILTRMSDTGETFGLALQGASALGYTESDPSADIEGFDAAAKLAILASLAFNARVAARDVEREGIASVTPADIAAAHDLGYEIKLVAVAERVDGDISARVHPAMVPRTHPLASVRDAFNAVFVEAEEVGELMLYGRGAGGAPTASAVVGDIVEIARNRLSGARGAGYTFHRAARMRPREEMRARYYAVLSVLDQPGVLSAVAGAFAHHGVSIASVRQDGFGDEASLVLVTHVASEGQHAATFSDLEALDSVKDVVSKMRVLGTSEG